MNSKDYWAKRETEALKHYIKDEKEYDRQIKQIYQNMLDSCQTQINDFYGRYAAKEGITLAEAKKRVSKLDIEKYERKAAKYVKDKDFSDKANEEMRLYNATMKINRLEMLKANIGLELISGHDELEKFMAGILKGRTEEELKRQAGILGKTIRNNAKTANAIVNGSFRVSKVGEKSTFSDYIWQYQDLMREDLGKILATGLIQGKNPRAIAKDLRKYWYGSDPKTGGGATYCMERLMRTELARVQTEAQKQSFERNGFEKYIFIVNAGCCGHCEEVADKDSGYGKGVYLVKDMQPGLNAPPIHPNDRCSTAAYEDSKEYEAWLDYLDKGGTTEEWEKFKKQTVEMRQHLLDVAPPKEYDGIFDDFEELQLTEKEHKALLTLWKESNASGFEYGTIIEGGIIEKPFTSSMPNAVQIPLEGHGGNLTVLHSHTNATPFSVTDFQKLLDKRIDKIGVIGYNADAYIAYVGDGEIPTLEDFKEATGKISKEANNAVMDRPEFFDWSIEERNYMAIREQAYMIAQHYGWTIKGGRINVE